MSGLYSRRKGMRVEYEVRDLLRKEGFKADRVPASGASQGFKGDIQFSKNGTVWLAEVKARGNSSFDKVYELAGNCGVQFVQDGWYCAIAHSATEALNPNGSCYYIESCKQTEAVLRLRKLLGTANILVIKADRKKPLFVVYRLETSAPSSEGGGKRPFYLRYLVRY